MSTIKTNNIQHVDATSANIALDSSGGLTVDTNVLVVDATNNRVGVGTASPVAPLHISGAELRLQNDTKFEIGFRGTSGSTSLAFRDAYAGSDRVTIDSSGRLLVGTSTAREVTPFGGVGYTTEANNLFERTSNPAPAGITLCTNYTAYPEVGSSLVFARTRATSTGGNTSVSSGDNLGTISFAGADGTDINTRAAEIYAVVDGTPGSNDMPGRLVFSTTGAGLSSPTERARIGTRGYLKTSNNGSYFSVNSNFHESNSSIGDWVHAIYNSHGSDPYGLLIKHNTVKNNTANWFLYAEESSSARFQVRSNGGIANYQSNDANLCDEREKKNIVSLDSTWDCLKHWELKKFHYNEDDDTADLRYGVIAQQVANYCPEVITDWVKQKAKDAVLDESGNVVTPAVEEIVRMGVKEQQMMWMAIKALQEAQLRIESLESEVAALKATINP